MDCREAKGTAKDQRVRRSYTSAGCEALAIYTHLSFDNQETTGKMLGGAFLANVRMVHTQ